MRFLAKKAGNSADENEAPLPRVQNPPPLPRTESQTDEERIRKFLEALGQPTSSQPPTPVKPRPVAPPGMKTQRRQMQETARAARRRNVISPLPPLTTVPPPAAPRRVTLPRQMTVPPVYEVQGTEESAVPAASAPPIINPVEAYAIAPFSSPMGGSKLELMSLLRSPETLRQAIILREIFGPPRSLQPFDQSGHA